MSLESLAEPGTALLVLLLAGHFIGDALLPASAAAAGRGRVRVLAMQVGLVFVVHGIVALPFLGLPAALALLGLALVHPALRGLRMRRASRGGLAGLLAIRIAHVLVVLGVWAGFRAIATPQAALLPAEWLAAWLPASVVLAAFAFNAAGGSEVVAAVLGPLGDASTSGRAGVGRLIGILERTITLILILSGQWAAMALLATAKSVARFDDLKDREFAEYYLVGTLTSLLVAIVIGLGLRGMGL